MEERGKGEDASASFGDGFPPGLHWVRRRGSSSCGGGGVGGGGGGGGRVVEIVQVHEWRRRLLNYCRRLFSGDFGQETLKWAFQGQSRCELLYDRTMCRLTSSGYKWMKIKMYINLIR